jgi:hypothetical protein
MKRFLKDLFTGKHAEEEKFGGWYRLLLVAAIALILVGYVVLYG